MRGTAIAVIVLVGTWAASPSQAEGDAARGKSAFLACSACHSVEPDANRLGPTLSGVVGRKAAAVPGFAYSPALKAFGLTWDAATLDRFIAGPRAAVPGTSMTYGGVSDAARRADIIAYLSAGK